MLLWFPDDADQLVNALRGARRVVVGTAILGGGPATSVIQALASKGVPVVVVTGCGGGLTFRESVERLERAGAVVLVVDDRDGALFHPKVVAVVSADEQVTLFVGSANLTGGGFRRNTEAVFQTTATVADVDAIEARLRSAGRLIPMADLPLRPKPPPFKKDPKRASLGDLLLLDWPGFVDAVDAVAASWNKRGWNVFDAGAGVGWMDTLDDLLDLAGTDVAALSQDQRDVLVGMRGDKDVAYFGDFAHTPAKQFVRDPGAYAAQSAAIDAARRAVGRIGDPITLAAAQDAFDSLTKVKWVSAGVASRLLLSVRPDVFVSVNRGSKHLLNEQVGLTFPDEDKSKIRKHYGRLLEMVMGAPWWSAPRPRDLHGRVIWDARAALLDIFLYSKGGS